MVSKIAAAGGCCRHFTFLGWMAHGAGFLSMITAIATDQWLIRVLDGQHVGIFPCCPTFKCGKSAIARNGKNIESFVDIVILGLLMVGLGWILSLSHFCVTWRSEKRTLFGLSYLASGLVIAGGIALLAGAIEFAANLPGDMEEILRQNCRTLDDQVRTGYSYGVFVAGAVAFILAGILLFLGAFNNNNPIPNQRSRIGSRQLIADTLSCNGLPLETVASHVAPSLERSSSTCDFSAEIFHNHLHINGDNPVQSVQNSERSPRVSFDGRPLDSHEVFLQLLCPPSYESLNEFFAFHNETMDVDNNEQAGHSETYHIHARSSPLPLLPPNYEDVLNDRPPPYIQSK